jgi:hypothetical protein
MVLGIVTNAHGRLIGTLLVAVLLATACQPGARAGTSASASPSPKPAKHVFVIVLENTSYQLALRQPYIASLATRYALATNYRAVANPSLPNYLAMTSGSTWGIRDDQYHQLPDGGVGSELTQAGISWKAYMEGSAWRKDGVLFIAWDESSGGDSRVALLVVAPSLRGQITAPLDHYSLSATISDQLGVPRLADAQQATSLSKQLQAARAQSSASGG